MSNRKHDWVSDEDVRWHLAAEAVIILFNERTMRELDFSRYAEYAKIDWSLVPHLYDDLVSHQKCLQTAVSEAHKKRFGCSMTSGSKEEMEALHGLILRVYCYYKDNGNESEIVVKEST